ncbi:MAG: hypothetical protein JST90_17365 [Bacteroidetes bacterium]|nr:hypothetical protein [Bacteroidota bacterium]
MSKFLNPQSGYVYHCINVSPEGDHIRPSTGYGGVFSEERQKRYGLIQEKPPLVFASRYLTKTLPFALHSEWNEKILNCVIKDSDKEFVLTCDRAKMLSRERDITVFKIADTNFRDLTDVPRQSISTEPVPFEQTEVVLKAKNATDLMRNGLQILSFTESYQELDNSGVLDKIDAIKSDKKLLGFLSILVGKGVVRWENKESGIDPDPVLAEQLSVSLKPAVSAGRKKDFKPTF